MKTRYTPKAKETGDRIFQIAVRLFQEKGYEKTSMRDIAKAADVSTSAAYYYFSSKASLVFYFYEQSQAELDALMPQILREASRIEERFTALVSQRLATLTPYRKLIRALLHQAGDIRNPLSPFSAESAPVRLRAIASFEELSASSDTRIHPDLAPHLPLLLWTLFMALLWHWASRDDDQDTTTITLLHQVGPVLGKLLKLSNLRLPGIGALRQSLIQLLEMIIDNDS